MKWIEYGQSKWGDIALARWLHWAYGPSEGRNKESVDPSLISHEGEIISVAVHPGVYRLLPCMIIDSTEQYSRSCFDQFGSTFDVGSTDQAMVSLPDRTSPALY